MRGYGKKTAVYEERPTPDTESPASGSVRSKCLLFTRHTDSGILLEQPE
jgi:hypothetical protein